MLRAASLPGQTFSRLSLRVQAALCRLPQTRPVSLSLSRETDESNELSDPVQHPHLNHVRPGRFQSNAGVSTHRQNLPDTPGTQPWNGSGITEDANGSSQHHPILNQASVLSSSTAGLLLVELATLTSDLRRMRSEKDVMEAWDMYQQLQERLSNVDPFSGDTKLLYTSLHHLIRLLSTTTPRSKVMCSRIISVLSTLRQVGGGIHKWELKLLYAIVKEQNLHPRDLGHLEDLVVDTLPPADPGALNSNIPHPISTSGRGNILSLLFDVPPKDLFEIDFTSEFQSPILVAPVPATFAQGHERARLLNVIGRTQSFHEAWVAYCQFTSRRLAEDPALNKYPSRHLHRMVSLLATIKPRTRKVYLALVSIISTLRASGHLVYTWEWNFLLDASAKGWRKTRVEDYKTSLRVFNDMVAYQREVRESGGEPPVDQNVRASSHDEESIPTQHNLTPDIYSYTTLISHAARTLSPQALEHARSLLNSSGINPNHVTLLSQLRFHTYHNQMYGVRRTISEIRDGGFTLEIHEVNSIIWAFARNEHLEVAEAIYRVLRNNAYVNGSDDGTFDGADEGIAATVKFLDEMEKIVIPPTVVPDSVTYTTLVQSYAYQGDLTRSLQILTDMLSSPDPLATWKGEAGVKARFQPVMQIYRALFLGFYRHGVGPTGRAARHPSHHRSRGIDGPKLDWNLRNLYALYKRFLELPADQKPRERTLYWLIMAFEKCSGGNYWKMREVWMALERKWGRRWGPGLCGIRSRIYDNTKQPEAPRTGR